MNNNVAKYKKKDKVNHTKLRNEIKVKDCRRINAARERNEKNREILKRYILKFKKSSNQQQRFSVLNSIVAKACKQGIIHRNKRDRLISKFHKQAKSQIISKQSESKLSNGN